jgi:hypothetical protein
VNQDQRIEELMQRIAALERQATAATDYIDICNLQRAYGYYVDKALWNQAADLFASDGTLEIAGRGLFAGQERVRDYLHRLGELKYGTLFNHMQLQPVIHVAPDGKTAKGRWRALIQLGFLNKEARWGEGTYENDYVKEGAVWKIAKLHFFVTFYVEFDKGWDKGGVPLVGPIEGSNPDQAATVRYEAYPGVFIPPYHYKNPVSGR